MSEKEIPNTDTPAVPAPKIEVQRILQSGEIDKEGYKSFYNILRGYPAKDPIILELATQGGDPSISNIWVETISTRHVATMLLCLNEICSAGIFFLGIPGSTRLCYPSTIFMCHQPEIGYPKTGPGSLIEWNGIAAEQCLMGMKRVQVEAGLSDEEVQMMNCSYDMYFDAFDALAMGKHGLIDGIIIRQIGLRGYIVITRKGYKFFHFPTHALETSPILTEEEIKGYGLPAFNFVFGEPACFARYKARNASK